MKKDWEIEKKEEWEWENGDFRVKEKCKFG